MKDPIILYPPTTPSEIWDDCQKWVSDKGGLDDSNPSQMMAAAGADPGCCSCPSCHDYHWAYGIIHKCPSCGTIYPTDWWAMLSWGSASGRRDASESLSDDLLKSQKRDEKYKGHPYWEYGYKHRLENAWTEKDKIDWKAEIGDCFISGGQFRPVVDYSEKCRSIMDSENEIGEATAPQKPENKEGR